jgi:hypothetical protein
MHRRAALLGLSAVVLFGCALVVFSSLNPGFDPLEDYVSRLGAVGQPYALLWNIVGFGAVGALLAGFGIAYGHILHDRLVSALLALFGVGFGAAGVPMDLGDGASPASKAHVVAVCLGLAAWLVGLARLAYAPSLDRYTRHSANVAAALVVLPIVGAGAQLWSVPVTHRLVFIVVFGWLATTSITLLTEPARVGAAEHEAVKGRFALQERPCRRSMWRGRSCC